ncbi:MAG: lipid II flippase MurJ [bacterium]|nr:lipid II flippase MurJ [bacterium]
MVKRILSFVGREIGGLHEAAYLLAGSAVLSLVFALVRDRLLAHILGASAQLDVYYAAFRIPDLIYVTVASLVSTSILVPFLIESRQKGQEELKTSIQNLFSAFLVLIVVVCAIAFVLMGPIQKGLFPNLFEMGLGADLVLASRILLLSPILLGVAGFFTSITQIQNRFLAYALTSPLYNVGIIIGILFFLPHLGVSGLAWGVALGALLLSLTQVPFAMRDGLFPRFSVSFDWARIKKVVTLAIPRTFTLSSQQLTTLSLVSFASFLGTGSISIFNLALNLQSVPLAIIGASYSSAAFPVLAKLIGEGNRQAFLDKMISATRHIIFWSVPVTVLFIVLRAQIVRVALGTGTFDWSDTRLTAAALALFVISSAGQSLMLLFVRSFYAEGKTAKPLLINVVSMAFTVGIAIVFLKLYSASSSFAYFTESLLRTDGVESSAVLMLPLAFTVGTFFNFLLHWKMFSRDWPGFTKPLVGTAARSIGSAIIGGYATYGSLRIFDDVFSLETAVGVFMQGICAGIVGMAVIAFMLWAMRSPELRDIIAALRNKVWKVDRASLDRLQS